MRKARPIYDSPDFHRWTVSESPRAAQVLDLERKDLVYVGGVPEFFRSSSSSELLSPRGARFPGVLAGMRLDGAPVGLWNFATSSGGCRETTHPGVGDGGREVDHNCYTFNGRGYARQAGLEGYDARYLSLSFDFRTFDEDAFLLLLWSHDRRRSLFVFLRHGKVCLLLRYGPGSSLAFETTKTYNRGAWVSVEAARAVRSGVETGVLRVGLVGGGAAGGRGGGGGGGGGGEDLMSSIDLPASDATFDVSRCSIYFGGVPPTDDVDFLKNGDFGELLPFLGSMRSITVSNPGSNTILNPLYSERHEVRPRFGVEPYCKRKVKKKLLFWILDLKPAKVICNQQLTSNIYVHRLSPLRVLRVMASWSWDPSRSRQTPPSASAFKRIAKTDSSSCPPSRASPEPPGANSGTSTRSPW